MQHQISHYSVEFELNFHRDFSISRLKTHFLILHPNLEVFCDSDLPKVRLKILLGQIHHDRTEICCGEGTLL